MREIDSIKMPENAVAERFGYRYGCKGTHTSRTIMLDELTQLFEAVIPSADRQDYVLAITESNATGKKTAATRRLTSQRLSELYGLDPSLVIFRLLRRFWDTDVAGRPLLAMLCSLARDPLLRITAPVVLSLKPGEELSRQQMVEAIRDSTGSRLNESSIDKVVRNCSSSWTQSGHLNGRMRKIRRRIEPTPLVVAYALVLGYLEGIRGSQLLRSFWVRPFDATPEQLVHIAKDAKRLGALDLKQAGDIVEFGFSPLLTLEELRGINGTH